MTTLVPPELINDLEDADIENTSTVTGASVKDALDTLDGASELEDQGSNIASAGTTNIGAADSSFVFITGTTTITSFGTTVTRNHMWIKFAGVLTLTHNATSLILPGAADITTEADDRCEAIRLSSGVGNWIIINYQRADGTALVGADGGESFIDTQVFTSSGTWTKPGGTTRVKVTVVGGGGAGAGVNTAGTDGGNGGNGGTSSFGGHCSATGGGGGRKSTTNYSGGTGGQGSNGDINSAGGGGARGSKEGSGASLNGGGGHSALGGGPPSNGFDSFGTPGSQPFSTGHGAGGSGGLTPGAGGGGGAGAGTAIKWVDTGLGATETITIGAGGAEGSSDQNGGAGGPGIIIVESFG